MKRLLAGIMVILMLSGCQLASEGRKEEPLQDQLVGVFVTFDYLGGEYDLEGWLEDHPEALLGGDVTLDYAESMEYAEHIPVLLEDDGWLVPGYEGLSIGRVLNGEYWTTISSEGVCELYTNIAVDDDGESAEVEGTVYFPAGSEVMLCNNPVYMTAEGEYYVVQGNSFHSTLEGGAMSQSVSAEKTWNVDGEQTRCFTKFTTTVQGVTPADTVRLIWMSECHTELKRAEFAPENLPESVTAAEGAVYLIVEEIAGAHVTRTLYQPDDENVMVFYKGEQPWCLPRFAEISWNE